jgi:hypothetical protein
MRLERVADTCMRMSRPPLLSSSSLAPDSAWNHASGSCCQASTSVADRGTCVVMSAPRSFCRRRFSCQKALSCARTASLLCRHAAIIADSSSSVPLCTQQGTAGHCCTIRKFIPTIIGLPGLFAGTRANQQQTGAPKCAALQCVLRRAWLCGRGSIHCWYQFQNQTSQSDINNWPVACHWWRGCAALNKAIFVGSGAQEVRVLNHTWRHDYSGISRLCLACLPTMKILCIPPTGHPSTSLWARNRRNERKPLPLQGRGFLFACPDVAPDCVLHNLVEVEAPVRNEQGPPHEHTLAAQQVPTGGRTMVCSVTICCLNWYAGLVKLCATNTIALAQMRPHAPPCPSCRMITSLANDRLAGSAPDTCRAQGCV